MPPRRYRSTTACHSCRQRKVRCSINITGVPCIRCSQDNAACVVDPSKESTPKRVRRQSSIPQESPTVPRSAPGVANSYTGEPAPSQSQATETDRIPTCNITSPYSRSLPGSAGQREIQDEEQNGIEIAAAAFGKPERLGQMHYYSGDEAGIRSTLTLCSTPGDIPRHFLIPARGPIALSSEEQNYLTSKGVFNLPSYEACGDLLHAYFNHVHPTMPVIEADGILQSYQAGQLHKYNLLLVWSVFFAAVNFIPAHVWEREGYESQKAMKAVTYSRSKCLYDNGGERDKVVLLQSSLLLGFWHSVVNEDVQPWYWTGISISLCQILGLHRDVKDTRYDTGFTTRQKHLWSRLWWTCFFRDRWLSLTLGRPLRINLDDCDRPMPSEMDVLYELEKIPPSTYTRFLPTNTELLAKFWVHIIGTSKLLGDTLAMSYRTIRPKPSYEQFDALEANILRHKFPGECLTSWDAPAQFYFHHLELHYQALLIVLYRPYIKDPPDLLPSERETQWIDAIRAKADFAASRTNDILETMAQKSLLNCALPMTPPLVVPAMEIHLLNCRAGGSLSRRLALNKLQACMMVMEDFQIMYTVASIYRGIFAQAIQHVCPEEDQTTNTSICNPVSAVNTSQNDAALLSASYCPRNLETDISHAVDALLDDSAISSFWDSLGHFQMG